LGGWEVFMVVGVRGFWGAAKPQAVSRCARFFWGGGWWLKNRGIEIPLPREWAVGAVLG